MKQVIYGNDGTPGSMQLAEGNVPRPGPGEILIEVHFAGINRPDVLQRSGRRRRALRRSSGWKSPARWRRWARASANGKSVTA